MDSIEAAIAAYTNFMWGLPLVFLLVGGGFFFMVHSRLRHFRYFSHSMALLKGKYDESSEAASGDISHYAALATALAGTMGLGNITGVAIAITVGGPGAIFWMWIMGFVGMATKYGEAVLAVKYRETDSNGSFVGGPMYYIKNGLGDKWKSGMDVCHSRHGRNAAYLSGESIGADPARCHSDPCRDGD